MDCDVKKKFRQNFNGRRDGNILILNKTPLKGLLKKTSARPVSVPVGNLKKG